MNDHLSDELTLAVMSRYMECAINVDESCVDSLENCITLADILKTGHCAIIRTSAGVVEISMLVS